MNPLPHLSLATLGLAALVPAQTAVTTLSPSPSAIAGNTNNYYPLGVNGQRYMQVHDHQGFTNSNPMKYIWVVRTSLLLKIPAKYMYITGNNYGKTKT